MSIVIYILDTKTTKETSTQKTLLGKLKYSKNLVKIIQKAIKLFEIQIKSNNFEESFVITVSVTLALTKNDRNMI